MHPVYISEDQRLEIHARSDASHVATSSPASIVQSQRDRTVQIKQRHLRVNKNS